MERTLDTVLKSISNPALTSLASGMVSRSPSPLLQTTAAQALMDSPSPPQSAVQQSHAGGSPRLHSLPDNTLNPLGLLAEASLANRRMLSTSQLKGKANAGTQTPQSQKVGVASEAYFKPGA